MTALKTGSCLQEIINFINTELKNIVQWFCANKMALNISKTKYVVFHNKDKNVDLNRLDLVIDENHDLDNPDPAKIHILEHVHNLNPNPSNTSYSSAAVADGGQRMGCVSSMSAPSDCSCGTL
jgi:hypothetical protein